MFLYHLKIILRNLRQNFTYSAINIAGLAIGITASVFIFLWVHHERSFDRYHADANRIYRINNERDFGGSTRMFGRSPYRHLYELRNMPEVEQAASVVVESGEIYGVKVNDVVFPVRNKAVYLDPEWFDMFDYTLLEGSFASFKDHPFSVVLTQSEARKYFGNVSAVGQTVGINGADHIVQAVIADYPTHTNFQWDVFASIHSYLSDSLNRARAERWENLDYYLFVKLRLNADVAAVAQKINDLHTENDVKAIAFLKPLSEIYYDTEVAAADRYILLSGDSKMVSLFRLLGILLLLTACINYVNLTTAKANIRTKEVGIKKIVGAKSRELFMQLIAESFIACLMAVALSLFLIFLFSPFYHRLSGNAVLSFSSPAIWIILSAVLFVTTFLNGIYPALTLSSFRPMNFLKGVGFLKMKGGNLRRVLVVFQFALSTTLIVYVMIIYAQMSYIQQKDKGYSSEHVISFEPSIDVDMRTKLPAIVSKLQTEPAIAATTLVNREITNIDGILREYDWDGREEGFQPEINYTMVDASYQKIFGLQLIEGRWFEEENASDRNNVILNETAIRELGIREPYIGQRFRFNTQTVQIMGVVKDFHYRSLHERIGPLVIANRAGFIINIKPYPGQEAQAMQAARTAWGTFYPNDGFEFSFLDDSFNNQYKSEINTSRMLTIFSVLAIFIALLGLFGLSTFAVERRFKEIGIRKILGASVSNIVLILSKEFLILVGVAMLIAFPLAYFWADKFLQDYAYRIHIGWWMFALAGIITLTLTLLIVGLKAVKAANQNPVDVVKSE